MIVFIIILLFNKSLSFTLSMGGNALKNVNTVRLNNQEYFHLKNQIMEALTLKKINVCGMLETPSKETFGDLDLLYCSTSEINMQEVVKDLFAPKEIVTNGDVISFDYTNFQVDLIKCKNDQQMKMAHFYYSYGDFGAILGRITNFYGIKFGHCGLFINLFQNTILNTTSSTNECLPYKINLSQEPKKICEFLHLDYEVYSKGFESTRDIFELICSSSFFKKEMFSELNRAYKKREKVRPMFQEFLDYLQLENDHSVVPIQNLQLQAINFFDKQEELKTIKLKLERETIIKSKFNASMFMKFGLTGKKLGEAIGVFKKQIEEKYKKDFNEFVYDSSKDIIQKEIGSELQNYLKT